MGEIILAFVACVSALGFTLFGMRLSKNKSVFSPISWFCLNLAMYDVGQALLFIVTGGEMKMETLVVNSNTTALLLGALLILVGSGGWVIGYVIGYAKKQVGRDRPRIRYRKFVVRRWVIAMMILSWIGIIIFARVAEVDFSDLSAISKKRVIMSDDGSGSFAALGYLRQLASLGALAFTMYLAVCLTERKTKRGDLVLLAMLFGTAVAFPVIASARGMIVGTIIVSLALYDSLRGGVKPLRLALWGAGLVFMLDALKTLRLDDTVAVDSASRVLGPLTSVFGYEGGQSVFNTGVIAEFFGGVPFWLGKTFIALFTAPIPRSLWPDKPAVSPDEYIATSIYGYNDTSWHTVPAGFVAELYMNFGPVGVFLGMLVAGLLIGQAYKRYLATGGNDPLLALMYCYCVLRFSLKLMGSNFSAATVDALLAIVPIVLVFYFARPRSNPGMKMVGGMAK